MGSDPSSVSGAALIEVAGRERELEREGERERERLGLGGGGGSRRLRAVVGGTGGGGGGGGGGTGSGGFAATTPTLRKSATATPGRRAGIWKSPRGEGPAAAGLGIKGAVREKGKERERERAGVSPRTEMSMSPPGRDDEEGVSTKGISL